jgi:hypothetical protein
MVAFKWTPPAEDGGTTLTGYKIAWCAQIDSFGNFANFVDLVEIGRATTTSFYLTAGMVTGNKYRFRVMAENAVGYGIPSTHVELMPASVPGAPNQPTLTTLTSSSIQISWTFDNQNNGGSPITDYTVYWDRGVRDMVYVA